MALQAAVEERWRAGVWEGGSDFKCLLSNPEKLCAGFVMQIRRMLYEFTLPRERVVETLWDQ